MGNDSCNNSSQLAPYALNAQNTKGRVYDEKSHKYRSDFARDRDRIIHSSAFRRLEGKTQVFTPGFDDNFRTRLTHSIEVAQIGRTIANVLNLNENITEAICLAHDLGHSPFGHCGEEVLNNIMKEHGGFEHNKQSMRVVEVLEQPYPDFQGLNLLYETRLGLSRHRSPYDLPEKDDFAEKSATLEGQIANVADRIAYNCHDLEDGLRGRMLDVLELSELELYKRAYKEIGAADIKDSFIRNNRIVKYIMDWLISDAISVSRKAIADFSPKCIADVMQIERELIGFNSSTVKELEQFEKFLLENMYLSEFQKGTASKVNAGLCELFDKLLSSPDLMPRYYQNFIPKYGMHRAICDYVSGMTDRYCLKLLEKR